MDSEKRNLRRYQDDLNVSGTGAVLMGVWSIVRLFMELFMGTKNKLQFDADDPTEMLIMIIAVFLVVGVLCYLVMKVHLYIGLNAIRASKEMPYKKGYLNAAFICLLLTIAGLFSYGEELKDIKNIDTTIASMLVDMTTIYIFIAVIVSTLKIKKIKEKEDQE